MGTYLPKLKMLKLIGQTNECRSKLNKLIEEVAAMTKKTNLGGNSFENSDVTASNISANADNAEFDGHKGLPEDFNLGGNSFSGGTVKVSGDISSSAKGIKVSSSTTSSPNFLSIAQNTNFILQIFAILGAVLLGLLTFIGPDRIQEYLFPEHRENGTPSSTTD